MYDNLTSHEETIIKCINAELHEILGFYQDELINEDDYIAQTAQYIALQGKIVHNDHLNEGDEYRAHELLTKFNQH